MQVLKRSAFTLFELLLVVVIIALIYSLVVGKLQQQKEGETVLTLSNLRSYMMALHHHDTLELRCIDQCHECYLYRDSQEIKRFKTLFESEPLVYDYDRFIGTKEHLFTPLFDNDGREFDVCFAYRIDPQGVGDSFLVALQDSVIYYPSYFGKTLRFVNVQEAVNFLNDRLDWVAQ